MTDDGYNSPRPLTAEQVFHRVDPEQLGFISTSEVEESRQIVGQDRALGALKLATDINADGFNLYVLGPTGSLRHQIVDDYLQHIARDRPVPEDWCYVHNFEDPLKPNGINLIAGHGSRLRDDMARLVDDLRASIPAAFDSENYQNRLAEIQQEFDERNKEALEEVQADAEREEMGLIPTPHGFAIAPFHEGRMVSEEEFKDLPEDKRAQIEESIKRLGQKLQDHFKNLPAWHKERRQRIKELDRTVTMLAVGELIKDLEDRYRQFPVIVDYLRAVQADVLENTQDFRAAGEDQGMLPFGMGTARETSFIRYSVNVLVDHAETTRAPVIYESNPAYNKLVGRIEHTSQFGTLVTDFTMIRPGALQLANGGFLIIDAERVLTQPFAWEALKRALSNGEARIESMAQMLSLVPTQGLEPDPMPLKIKLVLIGNRLLYYLLYHLDPDFPKLFKVAADFEDHVERSPDNMRLYGEMLATVVKSKGLRDFSAAAIARVIEQSSRLAHDRQKLSTNLQTISDLLTESDYRASEASSTVVEREHVQKAIDGRNQRLDRIRSEIHESIQRNTILISTDGSEVAQINALSVLQLGETAFGQPSRITATVRVGEGKVVDIEREVKLGGTLHSKGVLILSSFLGARYARECPLSLSASLVFEQTYSGIEGDSASVAELAVLLSAISGVPLRQSLAVTGSVNQHGQVQAIGGVNEKIEGFFDVCDARELTGHQGVLIPTDNVQHLMLRPDVVAAVEAGQFHIYPIRTIDEALHLLSELLAGERDADGNFPEGSFNQAVESSLRQFADQRKAFGSHVSDSDAEAEN